MKLLSIREAAKRLGVHPNRLREWEKKRVIHPIRIPSGHRRYPAGAVHSVRPCRRDRGTGKDDLPVSTPSGTPGPRPRFPKGGERLVRRGSYLK